MIKFLLLLVLAVLVAFGITVLVNYHSAKRPEDISRGRWLRAVAAETGTEWLRHAWNVLRGLPFYIRAWLQRGGDGEDGPGPAPDTAAGPAPARPGPTAPAGTPVILPPPAAFLDPAAPIPPDHAAIHARIASFEPGDDAEMITFLRAEAAARMAEAQAWEAHADTLVTTIGIDPAAGQAFVELAGVIGDTAQDFGMAIARYATVYKEVSEAVSRGVILPYKARDFLTGEV